MEGYYGRGIFNSYQSIVNTGDGNDIIIGNSTHSGIGIRNDASIDTGDGNDIITGNNTEPSMDYIGLGLSNTQDITTGDGNDIITGISETVGIVNRGTIDTGDGADSIVGRGGFLIKYGFDNIEAGIKNNGIINTDNGDDIITSAGLIYNEGVINTGNGNDSIIVDGGVDDPTTGYVIYNNGGTINMGDGDDSIIANEGFESGSNNSGAWFLGEGNDYIKGFGSGDFYGGNGNDTLELTPGTYTVGIWGSGGESVIFTKGNQLMITSEFDKLKAGNTIYDFTSLTGNQIIVVA
jgi:hypothetical protein